MMLIDAVTVSLERLILTLTLGIVLVLNVMQLSFWATKK